MTSADPPAKKSFADRLNVLMDTIPNPSGVEGRAWTNTELHDALQAIGVDVSRPYIGQLRTGQKDNPGTVYVGAIARVFGMPVSYFFDDDAADQFEKELKQLAALRTAGVHRLAMLARGLSAADIDQLTSIAAYIRGKNALPPIPEDDDPSNPSGSDPAT